MDTINIYERVALGKLAENLSFYRIKSQDLQWILLMHGISEFQESLDWVYYFKNIQPEGKKLLLDILCLIYTKYPDTFPKIMEEIIRKIYIKLLGKYANGHHYKQKDETSYYEKAIELFRNTLERYLSILNYEIEIIPHLNNFDMVDVKILKREIDDVRREERNKLYNLLEKEFPEEYIALKGAYERYAEGGTNAYRQAISSCRNAYENFFKNITESPRWNDNLKSCIESKTVIKFIKNSYSLLSGLGDHSPVERNKEDAFLAIRITEDILIRVLTEKGKY